MQRTMFNTPVIRHLLYGFSVAVLKLAGWKVEGELPKGVAKAVIIAAPHTTNWDMPFSLMIAFKLRLSVYWMGKKSIFKFPFGPLMRWMGGIPVDRSKSHNLVDAVIDEFSSTEQLLILMAPEGTRSKVDKWKSGFYHMAHGAGVPVVMGFIDYPNKRGGIGGVFYTTGHYEQDLQQILDLYQTFLKKGD